MSRRIKFRAWSPSKKEMLYLSAMYGDIVHMETNGTYWGIFKEHGRNGAYMNGQFGDVLMQWTGLKDVNGKKIYDGDIVRIPAEDGNFHVEWDDNTARYVMNGHGLTVDFDNFYGEEIEIIGNIYEHPELLEEGTDEDAE